MQAYIHVALVYIADFQEVFFLFWQNDPIMSTKCTGLDWHLDLIPFAKKCLQSLHSLHDPLYTWIQGYMRTDIAFQKVHRGLVGLTSDSFCQKCLQGLHSLHSPLYAWVQGYMRTYITFQMVHRSLVGLVSHFFCKKMFAKPTFFTRSALHLDSGLHARLHTSLH